jgi:hypothetical protein
MTREARTQLWINIITLSITVVLAVVSGGIAGIWKAGDVAYTVKHIERESREDVKPRIKELEHCQGQLTTRISVVEATVQTLQRQITSDLASIKAAVGAR